MLFIFKSLAIIKKKKIVVIGGGTGSFVVLSGLKQYKDLELTAIVSASDDGGSNKKFRDEFGLLPPSDFRQCLVALSSDKPKHDTMRKLMMYRFNKGVGLEGQTFGNILIAALTDIEGSQLTAFERIGEILNIHGRIIPITTEDIRLMAEYEDGSIAFGEHLIDEPETFHNGQLRILRLFSNRKAEIYRNAAEAIKEADAVILGPGDLYTSTLANFVVDGTKEALAESHAKKIYIVNLMTKYGQTYGFSASNHVQEIEKYTGSLPDVVLMNNATLNKEAILRYKNLTNDVPIIDDLSESMPNVLVSRADLVHNQIIQKQESDKLLRSLIRHDAKKVAKTIYDYLIKL